ncbi:MAG: sigma-70 family RNA polymerase sigma factor [Pseudomonadota bacterium]
MADAQRNAEISSEGVSIDTRGSSDPVTIEEMYRAYNEELTGWLRFQFGSGPPDPEDMAQQAFKKLLEKPDCQHLEHKKAFLWRTAKNLTISALRRIKTQEAYEYEVEQLYFADPGDNTGPSRVIEVQEQLSVISDCLRGMSKKRREVFVLHRVHGMNLAEVGRALGLSRSAATKRLSGALAEIDAALEDASGIQD